MSDLPAWWRCTESKHPEFTAGAAYEVLKYENGRAIIVNDTERGLSTMPVEGATFVPHDPWASYRRKP